MRTHVPGSGEWRPLCGPRPPDPGALAGTPCGSRAGPRRPRPRASRPALGKGRRCRTLPHTAPATPWPAEARSQLQPPPKVGASKAGWNSALLSFPAQKAQGSGVTTGAKRGVATPPHFTAAAKRGWETPASIGPQVEPSRRPSFLLPRQPPYAEEAEVVDGRHTLSNLSKGWL